MGVPDRVIHFGPSVTDPGGMAAVIAGQVRLASERGWQAEAVPTFTARSRSITLRLFATSLLRLVRTSSRTVVHIHVSQGGSFVRKGLLALLAGAKRLPVVLSLHGFDFEPFASRHPKLVRSVLKRAAVITVLSREMQRIVSRLVPETDVLLVHNFVVVDPEVAARDPEQPPRACFAGDLGRRKGTDVLLEAWPRVRERNASAELVLLGADPEGWSSRLPDGVVYLGPVPREQVRSVLRDSDVGVLPSRAEAMPMFVLETMAVGRAVVATDIQDLREIVGDGGTIVPPGDVAALEAALTGYLEQPSLARDVGRRAHQRAAAHFSPEAAAQHMNEVYRRALG